MDTSNNNNLNQDQLKAKEFESRLKNYTGPEGISTKELEVGLWYVEHKELLRKIIYGFLIAVAAVSWTYSIYSFAYYLARGLSEDEALTKKLVETNSVGHDYILQISAKQLAIAPIEIFGSGGSKYDFYVPLRNDNDRWWAEFDYYFIANNLQTPKTASYILPLETKNLLALAQDFSGQPVSAQLILENIRWHRLDRHKIPDWFAYSQSRLKIETADVKFTPASANPLSNKLNLNKLSFNVTNNTVFNYWQVDFAILLYGGGSIVGVNHYSLSDFLSGQKRLVELSWPGNLSWVDRVQVVPEINIMKDDIYIKYEGGTGQEK